MGQRTSSRTAAARFRPVPGRASLGTGPGLSTSSDGRIPRAATSMNSMPVPAMTPSSEKAVNSLMAVV